MREMKQSVFAIFMDLSKAFEKVNLPHKLKFHNFSSASIKLIENHFFNRFSFLFKKYYQKSRNFNLI
jgi:hypothetical protein